MVPMVIRAKVSPRDPLFFQPRFLVISENFRPMQGTCEIALTEQVVFLVVIPFKMPRKMPARAVQAPASCSASGGNQFDRKTRPIDVISRMLCPW